MGSYPTFTPERALASRSRSRATTRSSGEQAGSPLFNRAIAGGYPTGSTFKPITALAALDAGLITPDTPINDPGSLKIGRRRRSRTRAAPSTARSACGARCRSPPTSSSTPSGATRTALKGQAIQSWARKLGLGHRTGIDLPGEIERHDPRPRLARARGAAEEACERKRKVSRCGISDKRPWSLGDNINLAVGQGDVQATPLQMAVAYAAIENGGKVVRPHLGVAVEDDGGRELQAHQGAGRAPA